LSTTYKNTESQKVPEGQDWSIKDQDCKNSKQEIEINEAWKRHWKRPLLQQYADWTL